MAHEEAHPAEPGICILSDQAIVRSGLRRCIAQACMSGVVEAASLRDALACLRQVPVWLTVVHVNGHGPSALQVSARIRSREPRARLLVFVGPEELRCAAQLRQLQTDAYLSKSSELAEIVQALQAVHAGGTWCSPDLGEFGPGAAVPHAPHHQLTPREFLVFLQLAQGREPARIRTSLSLGPARLAHYRASVLNKLQAPSDAALMQYALRHGLVE